MLVLHSTSRCDVCLLEYTWETSARVPHAIACGHIFCRDCLYATTPPLCPLCRKSYQPAKIKKLHVDRPENVDEAREAELGRQQLELLEQLVEVWNLELQKGLSSDLHEAENRERLVVNRTHHENGGDHESRSDTEEDMHARITGGSHQAISGVVATDGQIGGSLGLQLEDNFYPSVRDRSDDVEHILDEIAGTPGVGRGFLERWGSSLPAHSHEGEPVVTMREAQKAHATEVLRHIDVWLEGKDKDSAIALRKSRFLFAQHLEVRLALKEALDFAKILNEDRSNMRRDLGELEKIKQGMLVAGEELQKVHALVEAVTTENQNLKARLAKRSRNPSPPLRNPLPRPPEPISIEHVPTFAQAMSEGSGSAYSGSAYSHSPSGSSAGVRFGMSPDSPSRNRERYPTGVEDGPSQQANPNGRLSRKKGKGNSSHYSYRGDSGYFDEENNWQQSSANAYPTSAPPAVPAFASSQRSNGSYNVGHDQNRHNGRHSSNHTTRSASQLQHEGDLDVYSATSHYLREYSAGFVNGQAAVFGVGAFASPPPQLLVSAPARTSSRTPADHTGSIVYTSESMEDGSGQGGLPSHSGSRSRSPSRSGHRSMTSQISNPQLASILLSSPPRRHLPLVSLPSISSHGQPSPSLSGNHRPPYASSHSSSNMLAHGNDSPRPSVASSGLNAPPSLPRDSEAAAAMITDQLMGQYAMSGQVSPSNRSQRTSVSSGWGTVYSNARSNSLISGLRGLPLVQGDGHDTSSVRTRATRFSMEIDVVDSGRDGRRESHASIGTRSSIAEIEEEARDIRSMVGVLPLEEPGAHSQQQAEGTFLLASASVNRMGSTIDTSPPSQRSATAVDRRMASDTAGWNSGYNSSQSRQQTGSHHHNSSSGTTVGHYGEYERGGVSNSPHHNQSRGTSRSRERRSNRDEDNDRYRRPAMTHRSQTSMGVSSSSHSGSGSSSWSFDHDSNNYQSRPSHAHNWNHEQISPTSHPSVVQPLPSNVNLPPPSRLARERDRDADRERSSRSRAHHHAHSHTSNTRPSLLNRDGSSAFPVSVESTDEEPYPRTQQTRNHIAMDTNIGRHPNSSSATISSASLSGTDNHSPLQNFGTQNALGLELITTANGINTPTPISRTSAQGFLRSFSHGDS